MKEQKYMTHDPAIYQDPVSGEYFIYNTAGRCRRSKDLIHFSEDVCVVPKVAEDSREWVGTDAIWAPDIVKVKDEYRLYCSNSSWGSRRSCIFLAVSDRPEGPFEPKCGVLKTDNDMEVNAIDANIIEDVETKQQYLLYGSFWGGCHMIPLDRETGMLAGEVPGICVARRPKWMDGAIEGPYMIYRKENGYYYLFVSYGSLKTDYNIRVGRSKNITGPFLDHNGRDLTDLSDETNEIGYLMAGGYQFEDHPGFMGPGHNSVLCNQDNEWFLVCHIRDYNFKKEPMAHLRISQIFWNEEGWPMTLPEPYAGKRESLTLTPELVCGDYEKIRFVPMLPQGVTKAVPMQLLEDGRLICCSLQGSWKITGKEELELTYGPYCEKVHVVTGYDQELDCETLLFTGTDNRGIAVWGKKRSIENHEK